MCRADPPHDTVRLDVLARAGQDGVVLIVRTALQALCDLRLPDAARAQEAEAPRRTPVAPLPGRPPQDGLSDRQHRLVLPDGPLVRLVRKAQETRPLVLRGLRDRDPRPPADDLFDQLRRDGSRRPLKKNSSIGIPSWK